MTGVWYRLGVDRLKRVHRQNVRGIELSVNTSPYQIPEAVSGQFDKEIGRFVIEFRYPANEEWECRGPIDEVIWLRIGKHTGRLYGIEIDTRKVPADEVRLNVFDQVVAAIDGLSHDNPPMTNAENYAIVKEAISDKRNELFDSVAVAQ
jgi:hypothetical protein